jgi:hypothetical protein
VWTHADVGEALDDDEMWNASFRLEPDAIPGGRGGAVRLHLHADARMAGDHSPHLAPRNLNADPKSRSRSRFADLRNRYAESGRGTFQSEKSENAAAEPQSVNTTP